MSSRAPLPIRHGLNPSRARTDRTITAGEFLAHLIATQRHRNPRDDAAALTARFRAQEVVNGVGKVLEETTVLHPGEDIWFYRMPMEEPTVPFNIQEVYRDENILVVNKPPFLATTPRGQHVTETALVKLRTRYQLPELVPAHRLDRLTSGLLVFIIRPEVRGAYQRMFENRQVHKTYRATAAFRPELEGARWRSRIIKQVGDLKAHSVAGEVNADTWVSSVQRLDPEVERRLQSRYGISASLGQYHLHPRTGKTHQLRLHMAQAGVPIVGDPLYTADEEVGVASYQRLQFNDDFERPLLLQSYRLEFEDPITHIFRRFTLDTSPLDGYSPSFL